MRAFHVHVTTEGMRVVHKCHVVSKWPPNGELGKAGSGGQLPSPPKMELTSEIAYDAYGPRAL